MITPDELLMLNDEASVPDREYVNVSPSASEALAVPTDVWFSATEKVLDELITGKMSLTLVTLMVRVWVVVLVPSDAVTVTE